MITILRGPRAGLARHGVPSDLTMRWDVSAEAPAWGAMRAMTGQLRAALGDEAVESALAGAEASGGLAALSLVWPQFEGQLGPLGKEARQELSGARVLAFPWAQPRTSPVVRAWAEVAGALVDGRTPLIVVPELERVDLSSLRAARAIVARTRGVLSFLIGHDTQLTPPGPFEVWLRKLKVRELSLLEALPNSTVEQVDLRSEPMMARRSSAFEEREPRTMHTMRAAFDSYAYDTALRLALELSAKLDGQELREAHALAALSARCIDPHARGDDFGVGMAEAGFLGALDGETDPSKRARWALELAILYTRAHGEAGPGLKFADEAVHDAEEARFGYLEAWARLARAQVRRLADRPEEAAADLEVALARLEDGATPGTRSTPEALLHGTRALAANERARIAGALGRRDELRHYKRIAEAALGALVGGDRLGYDWITLADDHLTPTAARAYHAAELARAKENLEPDDQRAASRALASAELCLGDARGAKECLDEATRISVIMKRPADEIFTLHLERIVAALRASAWDDAECDLSLVRADPRCEGDVAQAEALALLALVAAGKKDLQGAQERIATATAQALRSEASGAIARVHKIAADALLALGNTAEARSLGEKARAALTIDDGAEDVLGVLVTLLACGSDDAGLVVDSIARAADALGEVATWWELPRLLPHVSRVLDGGADTLDPVALGVVLAAASQRSDCAQMVRDLRALISK